MIKVDFDKILVENGLEYDIVKKFFHATVNYYETDKKDSRLVTTAIPSNYDVEYEFAELDEILTRIIDLLCRINSKEIFLCIQIKDSRNVRDGLYYIDYGTKKIYRYSEIKNHETRKGDKYCIYYFINIYECLEGNVAKNFLNGILQIGEFNGLVKREFNINEEDDLLKNLNPFYTSKKVGINSNFLYLICICGICVE